MFLAPDRSVYALPLCRKVQRISRPVKGEPLWLRWQHVWQSTFIIGYQLSDDWRSGDLVFSLALVE